MKKLLIILAVLLGISVTNAQFDITKKTFYGSISYTCTFKGVDSVDLVSGLVSDVFDWSSIVGDITPDICYTYAYTTTSANDTLSIVVEGYDPLTGNYTRVDTVNLTCLSTTNGGTTTYTTSQQLGGFCPMVRFKIIQKAATNDQADDGTFEITVSGTVLNQFDDRWRR